MEKYDRSFDAYIKEHKVKLQEIANDLGYSKQRVSYRIKSYENYKKIPLEYFLSASKLSGESIQKVIDWMTNYRNEGN